MVLFAGLALAIIQVSMASPPALAQVDSQFVPGQIIIRFHSNVSAEQILDFYAEYGLSERDDLTIAGAVEPADLKLASAPVDVNDDLIELLSSDPRVLYAEPNYLLSISQEEPDDPLYDQLWGLNNTGQSGGTNDADIDAPEAWEVSTGSKSVLIVVTDTGVDYTHEDLIDNMWANPKECPKGAGKCEPDGKDNDNNGYIDDFYGINTITDSGDPMDDFGHGTHVAGIIGATGDNATGVVGVNHTVRIVGCKFLSATGGGTVAAAVKCFQYIDDLKNKQGYNVVATNNSWGGGAFSQALFDAMNTEKPPLHICAAGNSNSSSRQYPAGYDLAHIISVAATDHNDEYASFSSYGADWVDLAAPGADILSTVPKTRCQLCNASGYRTVSGTSMATPHVAGAAALLKAKYSSLDNEQIKQRIISGIDPLQDDSKQTMTNGRLNLFNSLEEDLTPPSAVNDLALTGVLMTRGSRGRPPRYSTIAWNCLI